MESEGVVKLLLPVASAVPPVAAAYQSMVSPVPGVAVRVNAPVPQFDPFVPVGAAGNALTVVVTIELVRLLQPVPALMTALNSVV